MWIKWKRENKIKTYVNAGGKRHVVRSTKYVDLNCCPIHSSTVLTFWWYIVDWLNQGALKRYIRYGV